MAAELPPEQHASYSAIIDDILASSDLNTISAKRIRKGLQEQVDYDITPQKAAITDLIMLRFDKFQRDQDTTTAAPEPAPTTNGAVKHEQVKQEHSSPSSAAKRKASAQEDDDDDLSSPTTSPPPTKRVKKAVAAAVKAVKADKETDEEIAKRMQAELNAPGARSTRGGGAKRKTVVAKKKKTPEKKSRAKINSDDDSNVEGGEEKPERERKGGFHKPMHLSEPLAALLDAQTLSRPQTVKKIWAYVKERDLQDPNDKRQIRCDEPMRAVFRQERVHMFTMNKLLAGHLWPAEVGEEVVKEDDVKSEEDGEKVKDELVKEEGVDSEDED